MTDPNPNDPVQEGDNTAQPPASLQLPIDEHFENVSQNGKTVRRKGVYLLPNLITTAALFSGFTQFCQV